ncbi:polysaccharide deacetylase family protein [Desulfovibrio inopinatus]|uniref:polysaccharide deacetylase family protein n=1 Tax=Desulfovibrio inopinatus TaxID=102109 RepID=UPI0004243F34|nr:polysaccharide deacetylase family protein [Desulfovibrio inopinatus]
MSVSHPVMALWNAPPANFVTRLGQTIDVGLSQAKEAGREINIFFRDDDVSTPKDGFARLASIFLRHHVPLCAAVVPAWLDESSGIELKALFADSPELCFWHQHGWRHVNHQQAGKKSEFGSDRSLAAKSADIMKGQEIIQRVFGERAGLFFTPPWNRVDEETLETLSDHGYCAVSRSQNAKPLPPLSLPDVPVNVDLHTRKTPNAKDAAIEILHEIETGLASGYLGIMLHHHRMNSVAFDFLDAILDQLTSRHSLCFVTLADIILA